jgi:hypothetical protein
MESCDSGVFCSAVERKVKFVTQNNDLQLRSWKLVQREINFWQAKTWEKSVLARPQMNGFHQIVLEHNVKLPQLLIRAGFVRA